MIGKISTEEFLLLVEAALIRGEELKASLDAGGDGKGALSACNSSLENIKKLRGMIESDTLPRVSKDQVPVGTSLGLAKAVGEWTEDEDLFGICRKIDKVFGEVW